MFHRGECKHWTISELKTRHVRNTNSSNEARPIDSRLAGGWGWIRQNTGQTYRKQGVKNIKIEHFITFQSQVFNLTLSFTWFEKVVRRREEKIEKKKRKENREMSRLRGKLKEICLFSRLYIAFQLLISGLLPFFFLYLLARRAPSWIRPSFSNFQVCPNNCLNSFLPWNVVSFALGAKCIDVYREQKRAQRREREKIKEKERRKRKKQRQTVEFKSGDLGPPVARDYPIPIRTTYASWNARDASRFSTFNRNEINKDR